MSKFFKYLTVIFLLRFLFLLVYISLVKIEYIPQFTLLDDLGYLKTLKENYDELRTNFNLTTLRSIAGVCSKSESVFWAAEKIAS